MTDTSRPLERGGRRGRRRLSPVQRYEAFVQVLTGEMTVAQCADHWGVDRSTIMRAREVAKKGALDALASSRPGTRAGGVDPELVMARDEAARLGEALKEMAVKVTLSQKRALGVTAGVPPRVEAGTRAALLDLVDGAVGAGWSRARHRPHRLQHPAPARLLGLRHPRRRTPRTRRHHPPGPTRRPQTGPPHPHRPPSQQQTQPAMNTPAQCGAIKPPKADIYSEAPQGPFSRGAREPGGCVP